MILHTTDRERDKGKEGEGEITTTCARLLYFFADLVRFANQGLVDMW